MGENFSAEVLLGIGDRCSCGILLKPAGEAGGLPDPELAIVGDEADIALAAVIDGDIDIGDVAGDGQR